MPRIVRSKYDTAESILYKCAYSEIMERSYESQWKLHCLLRVGQRINVNLRWGIYVNIYKKGLMRWISPTKEVKQLHDVEVKEIDSFGVNVDVGNVCLESITPIKGTITHIDGVTV